MSHGKIASYDSSRGEASLRYRRADHVAWRRIDEEMVLVDLVAKEMIGLNAGGGEVWQLFETPRDEARIARQLAAVSADAVNAADVAAFVSELATLGLLVTTSEPSEAAAATVSPLSNSPQVLWREEVRQAAGTCAFLPGSSPLCNQAPFS